MVSPYLTIPQLRCSEMPKSFAKTDFQKSIAEKYYGNTRYKLVLNDFAEVWFAETTVKLTVLALVDSLIAYESPHRCQRLTQI